MSRTTAGQAFMILMVFWFTTGAIAYGNDYEKRLRTLEEKYESKIAVLDILERFSWKGDLRIRFQSESTETPGVVDERDRGRLRFRLGATIHMLEDLDIGFRMATGGLTARDSGNVTLDGGFTHKAFDLDMAFFRYQPTVAGWKTVLQGGKFKPPFMASEIIWDNDVTVEGIGQQFSRKIGDTTLDANFGQFIYDEFDPGEDIIILGYQGIITQKTGLGKFKVALAYYDVQNTEDISTTFSGSSTLLSNTSEVKILDLMVEWSEKIAGQKLKLFGEYSQNTGDLASGNPDLDTAWQLGAKYGSSGKKFGDYDMKIIYRVVQTEAVFDVISDSDFHDGRSNARGFKAEGSFGLAKGVKLRFAYFDTQEERGTQRDHEKFQADLKFKF
ncbi:MAG: hypothetical protein HN472_05010 [Nitrospina sp.]|jgi:hypothetical protein|nr:hypothetical protein [Nitrospina sp.]MBT3508888.1 hypothetical protein [Nitrospina sp.]MBT3876910.1 hypothetical protein [Nitrospina sp.]MBT4047962.1 hypothetical protein [Nitrospina sp.]MBT4558870.1 hypothetical protein [Nitrospina sp.]